MIERFVHNVIDEMVKKKIIQEQEREEYKYAFLSGSEKLITIGSILFVATLVKSLIPTLIFLFTFFSLRNWIGGFHLKTFKQCYIATIMIYFFVYIVSNKLYNMRILYVLWIFSTILIMIIGAVNHPNVNFSYKEFIYAKRMARILLTIESIAIFFAVLCQYDSVMIFYAIMGIVLCAILLVIAIITEQTV